MCTSHASTKAYSYLHHQQHNANFQDRKNTCFLSTTQTISGSPRVHLLSASTPIAPAFLRDMTPSQYTLPTPAARIADLRHAHVTATAVLAQTTVVPDALPDVTCGSFLYEPGVAVLAESLYLSMGRASESPLPMARMSSMLSAAVSMQPAQ